mmetsp:Transcript_7809/g.14783  ORF Transcript_7809/g.14783 Transcript_7809/m.14783 type:complete len:309 (-) Transcript_7809:306-1232(-)
MIARGFLARFGHKPQVQLLLIRHPEAARTQILSSPYGASALGNCHLRANLSRRQFRCGVSSTRISRIPRTDTWAMECADENKNHGDQGFEDPARTSSCLQWMGGSVEELTEWLKQAGLNTEEYGVGNAKPLSNLLGEVMEGETTLVVEDGVPVRNVNVVSVLIENADGQILVEQRQTLPDGRVRERGLPLSEKMIRGESWLQAAVRGIKEELGNRISADNPQITILEETYYFEKEEMYSFSYPGLMTRYMMHRVKGRVLDIPQHEDFVTIEQTDRGVMENFWAWLSPDQVKAAQKTKADKKKNNTAGR